MTRIRVLRIIDRLNVGGPALQATVLTRGLDPDRFEHRLVAGSVGPDEGDYMTLRAPDVPVETIRGLGRAPHAWHDVDALVQLDRIIRRFRPDIVHTHKAKAGVLGRLPAFAHRVPATVHTFHGHLLRGYFSRTKTAAIIQAERALARRTTRLVAVGAQVRDELVDAGIGRSSQYFVVPPGVRSPSRSRPRPARELLGLPREGPVVGFVGRLTGVKRPERFIDMALAISHRHPSTTFVITGGGELLETIRERARPLGARAVFLGWRGDIEKVYAACDLVALTSDNEGMPVSLIEAATLGTPAVTTASAARPRSSPTA